jgi:cytosine/adenosine deaminase-related metal-dependent hydrolase
MNDGSVTLGARLVVPVETPPIESGAVSIRDGRIEWIGPAAERTPDLDLGNVAILPGLVNAHTHLDLTPLGGPQPTSEEDELDWLRRVISQRSSPPAEGLEAAVVRNLGECLRSGTTLVSDISAQGLSWAFAAAAPIRAVIYYEMIGLVRDRGLESSRLAFEWLARIKPEEQVAANARPGLSPHAPYSTAGWLYQRAADTKLPLATHLAEMPEERELLKFRDGRLREFLEDLGAWDEQWAPLGSSPADYVRKGKLRNADWLIAHGTYLDPLEFWQLRPQSAPDQERVAIAFCPRTHARFGHRPHPFREMLERGVVVCIGTDSRASSPSLSVHEEIQFLRQEDPTLPAHLLISMATLFGAWALRADNVTGSLKAKKSADLAIIRLPDRDEPELLDLVLDADARVAATVFEGRFVHGPWRS